MTPLNDTAKMNDRENHTLKLKIRPTTLSYIYNSLKHCLIFPIGAIVTFKNILVKNRSRC